MWEAARGCGVIGSAWRWRVLEGVLLKACSQRTLRRRVRTGWRGVALACAASAALAQDKVPDSAPTRFEGAAGLVLSHGPAFPGSADVRYHFTPAGFLRYGRLTVTGAGGFTTRASDEVERGLTAELARRGATRLSLGLRFDQGRKVSDSADLLGMGNIRSTIRLRLLARWDPDPQWRLTAGASADALGHGTGTAYELGATRRWDLGHGQSWALGASLGAGDARYMQAWHGVTPAQSSQSGYAPFDAAAGLRDAALHAIWRTELQVLNEPVGVFVGASASRLLGSAAQSPLTRQRTHAVFNAGAAWRF